MKSYSVGQTVKTHGATGAVISGRVARIENSGSPGREVVYWVDFGGGDVRPVKASEVVESRAQSESSPETVALAESLLRPLSERDEFLRRWGRSYLREVREAAGLGESPGRDILDDIANYLRAIGVPHRDAVLLAKEILEGKFGTPPKKGDKAWTSMVAAVAKQEGY